MLSDKNKRGQLMLFVVIGVVVAFSVMAVFFFGDSLGFGDSGGSFKSEISVIEENLESCLSSVYIDSIELVGAQGGYYDEPSFDYEALADGVYLPYFKRGENISLPIVELIELEISYAIENTVDVCFREAVLSSPEFEIYFSDYNYSVKLRDDSVDVLTNLNVGVVRENQTSILEFDSVYSFPSKFSSMYGLAEYYVYSSIRSGGFVSADGILDYARKNELEVVVANYDDGTLIFSVTPVDEPSYPSVFNFLDGSSRRSYSNINYSEDFFDGEEVGDLFNEADFEEVFE